MPAIPCLDCGHITTNPTRCTPCQRQHRQHYGGDWNRRSAQARAKHLDRYGPVCPGYQRGPHTVQPEQLQLDHTTDLILCNTCNVNAGPAPGRGTNIPRG